MSTRRTALAFWFLSFPVAVTAAGAIMRQYNPLQTTIAPWWAEVLVVLTVALIFGRASGSKRQ